MNPDKIQKLFGALGINEATIHTNEGDYYFLANPEENSFLFSKEGSLPSEFIATRPFCPAREIAPKELHIALREENIQEATIYVGGEEYYYQAHTKNEFAYGPENRPPQEYDITGEAGASPSSAVEMVSAG